MTKKFQSEIVEGKIRSIFISTSEGTLSFIPRAEHGPFSKDDIGKEKAKALLKALLDAIESDWKQL